MVPKIAAKGNSFKGAGQYYLHDKNADTNARVEFTLTQNLPTDNPEIAIKMMAHTAMRQQDIKAASGQLTTGRKLSKPVYTYSLSWSPDQDPTKEQMIEAARETIKILGLEEHEILMVAHNDTPHPHIHVIANRVHPETGLVAKLPKDRLVLSRWAEDYERRHGKILCEQRVENNALRAKGQFVKYKSGIDSAAFHRWRKGRVAQNFKRRQIEKENLAATHKGERDALYDQKEAQVTAARLEISNQNRPQWAALFAAQETEKKSLQRRLSGIGSRLVSSPEQRSLRLLALDNQHERQREFLANKLAPQTKKAIDDITKTYKKNLQKLKNTQRQQRQALAEKHSQESQKTARDIAAGTDITAYRDAVKRGAQRQPRAAPDMPSPAPQRPQGPEMGMQPPIGPAHEARQYRALAAAADKRIEQRLIALKEQNRPKWAALFKGQREELRAFENAQQAALPRLFYHLRNRGPDARNRLTGAVNALLGSKADLKTLEQRHEKQRKALAREVGRERRATVQHEEKAYEHDLARLEKELAAQAASFEKAVAEGQTAARVPDQQAVSGLQTPGKDFQSRVRSRIEQAKKREQEQKRRRGREGGGRERDDD